MVMILSMMSREIVAKERCIMHICTESLNRTRQPILVSSSTLFSDSDWLPLEFATELSLSKYSLSTSYYTSAIVNLSFIIILSGS